MTHAELNSRVFAEHLHTPFQTGTASGALTLELAEVTDLNPSPRLEQFSLIFSGPMSPVLQQGTYQMEHAGLGPISLFLVPIGPEDGCMLYQAVFNRIRPKGAPAA